VIPPILNQPNPQPSVASLSPSSATAEALKAILYDRRDKKITRNVVERISI
jgi:hypothetical protein